MRLFQKGKNLVFLPSIYGNTYILLKLNWHCIWKIKLENLKEISCQMGKLKVNGMPPGDPTSIFFFLPHFSIEVNS